MTVVDDDLEDYWYEKCFLCGGPIEPNSDFVVVLMLPLADEVSVNEVNSAETHCRHINCR